MFISFKRNPVVHPSFFMDSTINKHTYLHKHIGLTFTNTDSWDEHVKSQKNPGQG